MDDTLNPAPALATVPVTVQQRLARAGLRRTLAVRAVLQLFLAAPQRDFSHAQAHAALQARGLALHRVSLYRLLDRLVACGVLQRHIDAASATRRYALAPTDEAPPLAPRFECVRCQRRWPLPPLDDGARRAMEAILQATAHAGHQAQRVILSVQGLCAGCALAAPAPRAGSSAPSGG
ncbi:Fur family transcriptional regulator [Tepidimonas charontis]|nr:Fur family transcriptional regulator [Tepidimonas charontis]